MATDYTELASASGGDKIAGDSDGTGIFQYVKAAFGADGTQTLVTATVGLPVELLAGTAAFGKLAANSGVDIGDVTLNAGTAEFGKLAAGVAEIGNVKNSGTFVVQENGAALTALQVIDNIVHVDDAAYTLGTDSGVMMMGFAGTQSVNANDAGAISMETDGSVHIHDGGNTITVDGTVTANPASGTIDTVTTVSTVTNLAQMGGAALNMGEGIISTGTQRVTLATDDDGVSHLATIAGDTTSINGKITACNTGAVVVASGTITAVTDITNTIDSTISGAALTSLQLIDDAVFTDDAAYTLGTDKGFMMMGFAGAQSVNSNDSAALACTTDGRLHVAVNGLVAHDTADSGNPVKIGAKATNSIEGLTQVAASDRTDLMADLNGCLVSRNGTTLEELVTERISNTNGTSTDCTGSFAAGGVGNHAYVTSVTLHNAHASTNGYIDLRDGAAGAIKWTFPLPATGGATHNFDPPLKFADNTAVAYDVSAAITTVYASFNGYFAQG